MASITKHHYRHHSYVYVALLDQQMANSSMGFFPLFNKPCEAIQLHVAFNVLSRPIFALTIHMVGWCLTIGCTHPFIERVK